MYRVRFFTGESYLIDHAFDKSFTDLEEAKDYARLVATTFAESCYDDIAIFEDRKPIGYYGGQDSTYYVFD